MIKPYLRYRKAAVGPHGLHSPFVFKFYNEVIKKIKEVDDSSILLMRSRLDRNYDRIKFTDLGAGSRKKTSNERSISEISRSSGVSRKYGRLLSQLVSTYHLENGLELGTSLGIGAAYLSNYTGMKELWTIEGCPEVHRQAAKNIEVLGLSNVHLVQGDFDIKLDEVLEQIPKIDLAFIDGNHQYKPTIEYFNKILDKSHNDTFIILDDINWSEEMRRAWEEIIARPEIHVSMELFRMGIVLKREEQAKEHFVLKF